jgi:glycosyltransferase involved in cell wall biosynthesis
MSKHKLLIISFTDASRDPRVHRQISYLDAFFDITVVATAPPVDDTLRFFPVRYAKAPGMQEKLHRMFAAMRGDYLRYLRRYYIEDVNTLKKAHFDLVIVNDALPIPFAFHIARDTPIIFDAHEFYPRQVDNSTFWNIFFKKMFENICHDYIKKFHAVTTVAHEMANAYATAYSISPEIVYSAPPYEDLTPTPVDPHRIRMIHHGGVSRQRKIEDMIKMMDLLDERYSLDLMLIGKPTPYFSTLRKEAEKRKNISWLPPVEMHALAKETNKYDIGLFIMPPTTYNLQCTIPNKFFEFIQARLAVAIGPSAGMSTIAREYGIGIIADDFTPQGMARKLNMLTSDDIYSMKVRSDAAAKTYNAEICMQTMRRIAMNAVAPQTS